MDNGNGLSKQVEHITTAALVSKLLEAGSSVLPGRDLAVLALKETLLPTRKTEAYKYTPVTKYLKKDLAIGAIQTASFTHRTMGDAYTIVFVNGVFATEHSDAFPIQAGVSIGNLKANSDHPCVEEHFGKSADNKRFFNAMNTAAPSDGIFLALDKGVELEKPIRVIHYTTESVLSQPRDLIILGDNAKAEIFFEQHADSASDSVVNHVRESVVGQGAKLTIHRAQHETNGPFNICLDQVTVNANGYFDIDTTTFDGGVIRNDIQVALVGSGSHAQLNGIYMLKGSTHVDNHTYIGHDVPDCTSDELYKGIVGDKATAVFNGKVQVAQDAQRTLAYQSNQNILVSDTANVYSKPELEIYADDVRCSHGCTIGRLDKEALFYLRTRGIGEQEATRLLTLAFCDDVLVRIKNNAWRAILAKLIESGSK